MSNDLWEVIQDCIPNDHARQVGAEYYIERLVEPRPKPQKILDLGCGAGKSVKWFRRKDPNVEWHGLDIESSPESKARTRTDVPFHTFDGINIPFDDGTFDIVFSCQVFEHVRQPEALLRNVARVLKPGGAFIGSVSYLEPYHSFSFWNYTPYGWHTLLEAAGLEPVEYRPGIDSLSLIERKFRQITRMAPAHEYLPSNGSGSEPAIADLRESLEHHQRLLAAARGSVAFRLGRATAVAVRDARRAPWRIPARWWQVFQGPDEIMEGAARDAANRDRATRNARSRRGDVTNWFKSSPLNEQMDAWGEEYGHDAAQVNLRKIHFCGHLVFFARAPDRSL